MDLLLLKELEGFLNSFLESPEFSVVISEGNCLSYRGRSSRSMGNTKQLKDRLLPPLEASARLGEKGGKGYDPVSARGHLGGIAKEALDLKGNNFARLGAACPNLSNFQHMSKSKYIPGDWKRQER